MDQAPFAEAQGRLLHQALAQLQRQRLQLGPGTGQDPQRAAAGRHQPLRQQGQPLQAIGQGHQVPG